MQNTDLTVIDEILVQEKAQLDPTAKGDEFFEFFAAQQVLRDYQLDPDEIKSGIVGQSTHADSPGSDGGIDAMYLLVNGRLIRDADQAADLTARGLTPNNSGAANWESMLAKHTSSTLRKEGRTSGDVRVHV
jgi:hypothetical protein